MAAKRHWITGALAAAALTAALAACSSTPKSTARNPDDGRGSYRIGKPYAIDGVTYYPAEDMNYSETGIASWYGPGFHGKSTANGEAYDQEQLSAAHNTLPLPTIVRVTNLDNGKSVVARVNDRGPFVPGRIIDMSKGGARELGLDLTGVARVKVEVMRRESELVKQIAMNGGTRADQLAALNNPSAPPPVLDSSPVGGPGGGVMVAGAAPASPPPVVSASQPIWSPGDPPPPKGANYGPTVVASDTPPVPSSSAQVTSAPIAPPVAASPSAPLPVVAAAAPPPAAWSPPQSPPQSVQLAPPPSTLGNQAAAFHSPPLPPAAPSSVAPAATYGSGQIYVQAGAFSQFDNAEKVRVQLSQYGRAVVSPVQASGRELYRVRLGPMATAQAADAVRAQVLQAGYRDARLVSD
jgi:rare lipoprotein A